MTSAMSGMHVAARWVGVGVALLVIVVSTTDGDVKTCIRRYFDQDSFVCVCNATYCDEVATPIRHAGEQSPTYDAFVSSMDGMRLQWRNGTFDAHPGNPDYYTIGDDRYQTIIGFGGAFTDASTISMHRLSRDARRNLLASYFGPTGIEYTVGRIPMASCDFSTRIYSYDDFENDLNLTLFSLAEEDIVHKIPTIKDAIKMSRRNISFFGSPWSSPAWMKTSDNMARKGTIKGSPGGVYFKSWAKYFVRFIEEYQKHGVDIWGITAQNEPSDGLIGRCYFQCLGWTAVMQRDFIVSDLGPALHDAGFGHVKLMILDDERIFLPLWAELVLRDPIAAKYVAGISVHWYQDYLTPPRALDETYRQFGDTHFLMYTEACEQDELNLNKSVSLGNWARAEKYFGDIFQNLKHNVSGWTDWNIALDMYGGPNWSYNFADSPVIINVAKDEFYKQPMFYAMGHFSKFIPPGSKRMSFSREASGYEVLVFERPDMSVAAVVANYESFEKNITIHEPANGYLNYRLSPFSLHTLTWWRVYV